MKLPEERKTPGRKPGVKTSDTVKLHYYIPRAYKIWLDANGGGKKLNEILKTYIGGS